LFPNLHFNSSFDNLLEKTVVILHYILLKQFKIGVTAALVIRFHHEFSPSKNIYKSSLFLWLLSTPSSTPVISSTYSSSSTWTWAGCWGRGTPDSPATVLPPTGPCHPASSVLSIVSNLEPDITNTNITSVLVE